MKPEEIRRWKRSALAGVMLAEKNDKTGRRASSYASAAALWEIALQLAIHNERESGIRRLDARAVQEIVHGVTLVAVKNQRMLRQLLKRNSRKSLAA